ncbi:UDP-N-acetylmuramate--L-alanine ligase [bacterium]|nr:UDP-N-acetylmuramate--L-alanine ligase [bacterium]
MMNKNEKIHCIGIGGIGLSGFAQILHEKGTVVSGSDMHESQITDSLKKKGIKIYIGHDESNLKRTVNKVIYSSAIPESNPELIKARRLNIPTVNLSEAIGEFTKKMFTIAICGTHGKTTVTSMSTLAMIAGDKDPTVMVGSNLKELGNSNHRLGKGDYFVVEACEYKRNFLNYSPKIIVITNIEADHLDYYKDLEDYKNAFKEFVGKLPEDGYLIANIDDENVGDILKGYSGNLITFGSGKGNADWVLRGNKIEKAGEFVGELNLSIPGTFNMMNALAAMALGQILHIEREKTIEALNNFKGAWRRFELIGKFNNITLISDYAHHPTEIKSTVGAARERYKGEKICCVFQPHQYNRTKNLLSGFSAAFKDADIVIIPNIYKVRDTQKDTRSISANDLVELIKEHGVKAYNLKTYKQIKDYLSKNPDNIEVVIIMGAGDIWELGDYLLNS